MIFENRAEAMRFITKKKKTKVKKRVRKPAMRFEDKLVHRHCAVFYVNRNRSDGRDADRR